MILSSRWTSWRWRPILEKWGHLRVFINPRIVYTTTFLIGEDGDPVGTVFFVTAPYVMWDGDKHGKAEYAITARHCVNGEPVSIRFRRKDGSIKDVPTDPDDWVPHPETDLAALPLDTLPLDDCSYVIISYYNIASS